MKILIVVATTLDNAGYSKLYEKQKSTWDSFEVKNVSTLYYIGNGSEKKISGHFVIDTTKESHQNMPVKFYNCLELTFGLDYDYIFHTNSISYVDKNLLYEWLLDKPREKFYSGVNGGGWASGCGFTISKDVVKLILENKHVLSPSDIFDVMLGTFLSSLGIVVFDANRFDIIRKCDLIPTEYFHYRCKDENYNKELDMEHFQRIFDLKNKI